MAAMQDKVAGLRRFGAAALDLAFVAAGRLDGFWERNLSSWDIAAGQIMVREAGGTRFRLIGIGVSALGGAAEADPTDLVDELPSLRQPKTETRSPMSPAPCSPV